MEGTQRGNNQQEWMILAGSESDGGHKICRHIERVDRGGPEYHIESSALHPKGLGNY